jgi:hypothetical protein
MESIRGPDKTLLETKQVHVLRGLGVSINIRADLRPILTWVLRGYCHGHNECKGENSIDWHWELFSMREDGDPEIPEHLKHPFKKCNRYYDPTGRWGDPGKGY